MARRDTLGLTVELLVNGGMEYSFFHFIDDNDSFQEDQTGGVGLIAGGGYLLNRNSTVNMKINLALSLPTYRIEGNYYPSLRFGVTTSISR